MSDQFGKQATFILPDGEKITLPFVGELKLHEDKPSLPFEIYGMSVEVNLNNGR